MHQNVNISIGNKFVMAALESTQNTHLNGRGNSFYGPTWIILMSWKSSENEKKVQILVH